MYMCVGLRELQERLAVAERVAALADIKQMSRGNQALDLSIALHAAPGMDKLIVDSITGFHEKYSVVYFAPNFKPTCIA